MSFFGVCLFSKTSGQILNEGKPVEGANIIRTMIWQNKTFEEKAVTDKNGNFTFDAKIKNSLSKFIPVEVVVAQKILIEHNGIQYEGWKANKRDAEENTELNGRPINLKCELTDEVSVKEQGRNVIKGMCRWDY